MKIRRPGTGMGFSGTTTANHLTDREKVERVEALVTKSAHGGVVSGIAARITEAATADELSEFHEKLQAMAEHRDLLATHGVTKQILDIGLSPAGLEARDKLVQLMNPLSTQERELVYQELDTMQRIVELRERISDAEEDQVGARKAFDRILPEFQEKWLEVVKRSKVAPVPPSINTATNIEALFMASAYVMDPVMRFSSLPNESHQEPARKAAMMMIVHLAQKTPSVHKIISKVSEALGLIAEETSKAQDSMGLLQVFAMEWLHSGFAKLEIGHKLAASLALTDVPDDIEVHAPWGAWSLIVPPGLMGVDTVARVWCEGTQIRFLVQHDGTVLGPITHHTLFAKDPLPTDLQSTLTDLLAYHSLVQGCCLALSNPDDYRKQPAGGNHGSKPKRERHGAPDFNGTRFMLSAPVTIDMREHLLSHLTGAKRGGGGSPTVQFLVRGHWRNQAHGPGRSLRKQIRIEAFWKGPEDSRILLRNYKTKEDE